MDNDNGEYSVAVGFDQDKWEIGLPEYLENRGFQRDELREGILGELFADEFIRKYRKAVDEGEIAVTYSDDSALVGDDEEEFSWGMSISALSPEEGQPVNDSAVEEVDGLAEEASEKYNGKIIR